MAKHFNKAGLITRTASLLLGGLFCLTAHAATPADFTATYVLSNGKPVGHRSLTFKQQNGQYSLSSKTVATGLLAMLNPNPVIEVSKGSISSNKVKPASYKRTDKNNPKKNLDLSFNWKTSDVLSKTTPNDIKYKLSDYTHDLLSETLMLMISPPGTTPRKLDLAYRSRPKLFTIKKVGDETIKTTAGTYKTSKYQRNRIGKNDRVVYMWCAPSLNNLPVKIEKHKKGNVVSMELTEYK